MDKKQRLKKAAVEEIEKKKDLILDVGEKMYENPELGYKENFATDLVSEELEKLDLEVEKNIAVTGCKAGLEGSGAGPTLAVMGELDAVIVHEHPDADPETGAVHACGHNIQTAAMLGVAHALSSEKIMAELAGEIVFMAVPAEEFVELDYRSGLKEEGKIDYFGGKQEMIKRGHFDDVDMAMMIHSLEMDEKDVIVGPEGNGFIGKNVNFVGREAHAGSAPEEGVNALNAAMLAMNNIHAQRETFPDDERVRVHPIITKGGDIVNVVPSDVRMETYVRARTLDGLTEANEKVNRALRAGGDAVGAEVKIEEIPGYLPMINTGDLDEIFADNAANLTDEEKIQRGASFAGSFDFGDLTHIMPGLHPLVSGVRGSIHSREFEIEDREKAYLLPAKVMAMSAIDLLYGEAEKADRIIDKFEPVLSKEEYIDFLEEISS